MNVDWINDYVGKPYLLGARGPDAYDCWGLVMAVYRDQLGTTLPDWGVANDAGLRQVVAAVTHGQGSFLDIGYQVDAPREWDIFTVSRARQAHHAGVVVPGGVLHSMAGCGTVFEPMAKFVRENPLVSWWRCRTLF
jgi:cell wall-associated NlpC family hydrolase